MTDTTYSDGEGRTLPFADFLQQHVKGATHAELSEALRTVVAAVKDTGKSGSITLTVTVAPMKRNQEVLEVSDTVKVKLPEHDRDTSIFFADDDNNLTRDNPNQPKLPGLKDVSAPPVRDASRKAGTDA